MDDGSAMPLTAAQEARFEALAKPVDICFVLDTTESMPDMIDGLVMCIDSIEDTLDRLQLDWRMTAVAFGDLRIPGDRIVGDLPFVATAESARRLLRDLPHFYGGGNSGRSSLEAVLAGLAKPYRPEAVTVIIVLTDDSRECTPDYSLGRPADSLSIGYLFRRVSSAARLRTMGARQWRRLVLHQLQHGCHRHCAVS